jgi:hypothetical protein
MLKLLFKLLALSPDLYKGHAKAYADFASWAWDQHLRRLKYRWALYVLSAASLMLGLIFSGLAILLWSALPVVDGRYIWVLWGLPLLFLGLGAGCWARARSLQIPAFWDVLKEQIQLDILMLEQAKTP